MDLKLRPAEECKFDAVSLGEVMLRLDPGEGRIRTARNFRVWEGGGEYNVVRGLHKAFGMRTAVITAFADNEIGKLLKDFIEQGGVDTSLICWKETDGIGRTCRNGLNFTERGFGLRRALACSDRANTAISQVTAEDFDFEYIFGTLGVRWLHTGGIYAALCEIFKAAHLAGFVLLWRKLCIRSLFCPADSLYLIGRDIFAFALLLSHAEILFAEGLVNPAGGSAEGSVFDCAEAVAEFFAALGNRPHRHTVLHYIIDLCSALLSFFDYSDVANAYRIMEMLNFLNEPGVFLFISAED